MKYRITLTLLDGTSETSRTTSDATAYAAAQGGRALVEIKTMDGWQQHAAFYPIEAQRARPLPMDGQDFHHFGEE